MLSSRWPPWTRSTSKALPAAYGLLFALAGAHGPEVTILPQGQGQGLVRKEDRGWLCEVRFCAVCFCFLVAELELERKRSISRGTPSGIFGCGIQGLEVKGTALATEPGAASIGKRSSITVVQLLER